MNCRLTMDISGRNSFPTKGLRCTGIYRDIRFANCLEHAEGVRGAVLQGSVPVDGADAEEIEARVMGGEDDGEGVLGVG